MKFSAVSIVAVLSSLVIADELKIETVVEIPESECTIKTKKGDFISVHYSGSLKDGSVFDSSYSRNQPLTFQVGSGQVIKGWDQGLLNMCIGEKRKLTIPSDLAYGDKGVGPIPPKAVLIFETELVDIAGSKDKKPEKDEL